MSDPIDGEDVNRLSQQIADLSDRLERASIAEYIEYYRRPGRVIYVNFVGGLARGLGIAIGTTVLFAIVFYLLTLIVKLNLPGISRVIAEIANLVKQNLDALQTYR